jgi:CubicO group peptidase (beta-lactamase class C family)
MGRGSRIAALALAGFGVLCNGAGAQNLAFSLFERYVEPLRVQLGIPGLSAAIVQDGQIVWEKGFGQSDVENFVVAKPDTPYNIADLTQTFTTILLAQCAERGRLQADDPIRRWVPTAADPPATLRQVLSHSSGLTGGFRYDLSRFALLTKVVESCANLPYRTSVSRAIIDRVAMIDAAPGRDLTPIASDEPPQGDQAADERYGAALRRLAVPYRIDKRGRASRGELPPASVDAATGLIASVRDLAKYDGALDILIRPDTLAQVWTNASANGTTLPTALGWFAQTYEGQRLVWQFGLIPDAYSSLILKIPSRRLTLIMLANSDGLSAPFAFHEGDVTTSLFVRAFLKLFL